MSFAPNFTLYHNSARDFYDTWLPSANFSVLLFNHQASHFNSSFNNRNKNPATLITTARMYNGEKNWDEIRISYKCEIPDWYCLSSERTLCIFFFLCGSHYGNWDMWPLSSSSRFHDLYVLLVFVQISQTFFSSN